MLKLIKKLFSSATETSVSRDSRADDSWSSPSRKLLKEATKLKKENKLDEACDALREAYKCAEPDELLIKEYLRLPMYLQLAGRNDEGWATLNELNMKFIDGFSQVDIANQMRIFLEKEKNYKKALVFQAWTICCEINRDKGSAQKIANDTDELAKHNLLDSEGSIYGYTNQGNPISDPTYKQFYDRAENAVSKELISERITSLLKKQKQIEQKDQLTELLAEYLASNAKYELRSVSEIVLNQIT